MRRMLALLLIVPIRAYQRFISPMRPPTCRFHPSCSAYAVRALEVHGPFIGTWLALKRLGRCHPWTPGGVDHVPPRGRWRTVRPPYDPRAEGEAEVAAHDDDARVTTRWSGPGPDPSSLDPLPEQERFAAPASDGSPPSRRPEPEPWT